VISEKRLDIAVINDNGIIFFCSIKKHQFLAKSSSRQPVFLLNTHPAIQPSATPPFFLSPLYFHHLPIIYLTLISTHFHSQFFLHLKISLVHAICQPIKK
jgi:hypothetical protein